MSTAIGIIGSGIVGQVLANGFIKHGYNVTIGTNTASKRDELEAKTNGKAKIGSFEDVAKFGDIVVLPSKARRLSRHCRPRALGTSRARPSSIPRIPSPTRRP